jgi:hypothetical protein
VEEELKKDKIHQLGEGFHFKPHGRSGYIYYVLEGKVVPIWFEMAGSDKYDVLVQAEPNEIFEFVYPEPEEASKELSAVIYGGLIAWLNKEGLRHDLP